MRIHTNTVTEADIRAALTTEKDAGRIARQVTFKTLTEHGSTARTRAFEVQLEAWEKLPGDGRRYGNSGSYGRGDEYTATFDEWGWLLAALYAVDRDMLVGSVTYPNYSDAEDFQWKTGLTYEPERLLHWLSGPNGFDPFPYLNGRNLVGRRGAGRVHIDAPTATVRHCTEMPRTIESVRAFAHLDAAAVTR